MAPLHRSDVVALVTIAASGALTFALHAGVSRLVLAPGAGPSGPPDGAPRTGAAAPYGSSVPLELTSIADGLPITGGYSGRISLEDGDLVFRVSEATVRTRGPLPGEHTLTGLRLALARGSERSWTTVEKGVLLPMERALEEGRTYGFRGVELRIEGVRAGDLRGAWPVVLHEFRVRTGDPTAPEIPSWSWIGGPESTVNALWRTVEAAGR